MVVKHREAYIIAGVVSGLIYIVLLTLFHIVRYCIRKCPSWLTGRQSERRDPEASKQVPQRTGRRVIVLNTRGVTTPGMIPANLNNPMATQQMPQPYEQSGTVGNMQNFQNIERVPFNNGGYPGPQNRSGICTINDESEMSKECFLMDDTNYYNTGPAYTPYMPSAPSFINSN